MIAKQCGGRVPERLSPQPEDDALMADLNRARSGAERAMADQMPHLALEAIWTAATAANGYFAEAAPWASRKTDPARADTVLAVTLEAVRRLAILASWAIPGGAGRLLDQLAQGEGDRDLSALDCPLRAGTVLPAPDGVFPRLDPVAG